MCADSPVVADVAQTIVHNKYDPGALSRRHDIALLRLREEVQFTSKYNVAYLHKKYNIYF